MTSMPAPATAQHRAPPRRWHTIAGATAAVAGAVMVTGAFLPWVETFAGLISIPGVRGSYGRILAAAGAGIAVAGLWHAARGGRCARWLAGLGGFTAAGFAGYLLIQLAATTRSLGGDSMVLARGGPGLWVTAAGALAAFATVFLPIPPAAAAGDRPAWRTTPAGRAARLATAVLHWTADRESSGARRGLQVALGLVWLADAALQFQPALFGRGFVTQVLAPASAGNPAILASPALWAARLIGHDVAAWNSVFALTQLAIALGLLWRPTVRAALTGSILWSIAVWWLGEGMDGLLTGAASPVTGAPGAVILYALLAVLAWPARPGTPAAHAAAGRTDIAAASPLGTKGSRAVWLLLWGGFAYLILQPAVRAPGALPTSIASNAAGEPGWLATLDHRAAAIIGPDGMLACAVLAGIFLVIAVGILAPATARAALALAGLAGLAVWVAGENFGMIFTGMATDPNTGPLLLLLATAYWPLHPAADGPAPAATTGRASLPSTKQAVRVCGRGSGA